MKRYDAIIIGAGQAGPALAGKFSGDGKKIAIAEGYKMGGSCVNYGCRPTKSLIASAKIAHHAKAGEKWGVHAENVTLDWERVQERRAAVSDETSQNMEEWMRGDDNMDVYMVYAQFEGTVDGYHQVRVGDEVIESEQVFINTGARARIPDIEGIHDIPYLTSKELVRIDSVPEHLIILGGSYIGLEMAQAFRRFGSEVTVLEQSESIVFREDTDIQQEITRFLKEEGINIYTNTDVSKVEPNGDGLRVYVEDNDGNESTLSGSHLLLGVGRIPNSDNLNLEAVGVEVNDRGYIVTDKHLRTNVDGIWALGDVNGRGAFTHTSYQDFEIVWDNLNGGDRKVDRFTTYNLYTDPPLGRVGMSEKQARESDKNVLMATKPLTNIGRAIEQGMTDGLIKLLVDADTEEFLGAAVLGFQGDDVIQAISYFMYTGASYKVMQNALPIHPTIAEFLPTILGELAPLQ